MSSQIEEFNNKIKNYIERCINENSIIPCDEESLYLTEKKCVTIYNLLLKEREKKKTTEDFKQLLEDLKKGLEENQKILSEFLEPRPNDIPYDHVIESARSAIVAYQCTKRGSLITA
ncbi:hypothetical protein AVEN_169929-1 [Araneus ventricosus]|uniref:Uncharacterized protein n=1 Tax=Araneus ventricosus TaxID=182803 RepID=A0A4Y2JA05_ARAVE|nr:hypothetical protein AVEN_169929-1 [Araneus ventricosus]